MLCRRRASTLFSLASAPLEALLCSNSYTNVAMHNTMHISLARARVLRGAVPGFERGENIDGECAQRVPGSLVVYNAGSLI